MSSGSAFLASRVALVIFVALVPPFFSALIGRGRQRSRLRLAGTLGGVSFGVLVASPVSHWLKTDASVLCAFLGIVLGWTVSWVIARRMPPEAS
jgi:hypothetical protein